MRALPPVRLHVLLENRDIEGIEKRRDADARALRKKFEVLDKDPKTAKLEKRLAELEPRVSRSRDPDDLTEISKQQRNAFYRCD